MTKKTYFLTFLIIFALLSCGDEKEKEKELVCKDGYKLSLDKKSCNDIDECLFNNGGCEEICNNLRGSFTCECENSGYVAKEDGSCVDLDECSIENGGCEQNCNNNEGSYQCFCELGYVLNEDNKTCNNIDDCPISCKENGECIDGINSYLCECHDNYTGDNCDLCIEGYEFYNVFSSPEDLDAKDLCLSSPEIVSWGTNNMDFANGFVLDSNDNIYVVGDTYGIFENYSSSDGEMFLSKFDKNLELKWTKQFEWKNVTGDAITIDKENNIYITGIINGSFTNQNNELNGVSLIKLDTEGNVIRKTYSEITQTTQTTARVHSMAIDENKNTYIIASKSIYLENGEKERTLILKKFNSQSVEQWTKEKQIYGTEFSYNIAIDTQSNIYLATTTMLNLENTENHGGNDILILKYDTDGNEIWIKQWGSENHDYVGGFSIKNDQLYITGYTNGRFEPYDEVGYGDIFLIKFDTNGEILINESWSNGNNKHGTDIAISDNNEIYISGYSGNLSSEFTLKKLDSNAKLIWTKQWSNTQKDLTQSLNFGKNKVLYGLGLGMFPGNNYNPFLMKLNFK